MAAHPFGPIEKLLPVTYNKKFSISKLKPHLTCLQDIRLPNKGTDPLYAMTYPYFHPRWSPNSGVSGDDLGVSWSFHYKGENLLSRGLGYRITFTMPNKDEHNPNIPEVKIEILDFFAVNTLRVVHFPREKMEIIMKQNLKEFVCLIKSRHQTQPVLQKL